MYDERGMELMVELLSKEALRRVEEEEEPNGRVGDRNLLLGRACS